MDFLTAHAQRQPDRPAGILADRSAGDSVVDYATLEARSNRLANALLELGIHSGDRCTTVGYNSTAHPVIAAANRKLVVVGLPMSYRLNAEEVRYQLEHSQSAIVFAGPQHVERIDEASTGDACPELLHKICWGRDEAPAGWLRFEGLVESGSDAPPPIESGLTGPSMTYTAGTTGNPKGAFREQGTRPEVIQQYMGWFDLRPGDVHLVAGPLYHSAPAAFAAFNTILGGTNVLLPRFDPEAALDAIARHGVTTTFMAPILLQRIVRLDEEVRSRYDVSSMRSIIVAAAPCPFEVKRRVMEMFGEVLFEFYGSSELGCNTVMRPEDQLRKPGSCGKPVEGVVIKVLDDDGNELPPGEAGELYIESPQVITRYWRNDEATAQARRGELFSVGDVGYFDEEGFLFISDRKRDMVISGGVNICTSEIENVIHSHPEVWDTAVFGIPSEEWGESVHAVVQPQPGHDLDPDQLGAWLRSRLADYKQPRSIEIREELPRDEAGKIRKRDLREPFWSDRETRV